MTFKKMVAKATPFLVIGMCITGCGNAVIEDEPIVKVDVTEDEIQYKLGEVSMGEVVLTQNISCDYVQTQAQEVAFETGGKIVDKVYVKEGDVVEVGDLLVELESGNMDEEIADLEYNIARNEKQLGYLDTYERFDLESAYYDFVAYTEMEEDDLKKYNKTQEDIKESYTYRREDFEDTLYYDGLQLSDKKKELASNRVYATMPGTVIRIKSHLEGSTAKRGDVIMMVVDNSTGLFEVDQPEIAAFISEGDILPMSVVYSNAKGDYELTPYQMSQWGEKQTFQIVTAPEGAALEVGTTGTITATVDKKENVLRMPKEALYQADGKYYTYTLDADNMRQVRFIEIGLVGDKYVEVLGGISDGEKVIRK